MFTVSTLHEHALFVICSTDRLDDDVLTADVAVAAAFAVTFVLAFVLAIDRRR